MGKVILKTDIERESGFLYYCGSDKKTGKLTVCQAVMARGRKATKKKTTKKKKK